MSNHEAGPQPANTGNTELLDRDEEELIADSQEENESQNAHEQELSPDQQAASEKIHEGARDQFRVMFQREANQALGDVKVEKAAKEKYEPKIKDTEEKIKETKKKLEERNKRVTEAHKKVVKKGKNTSWAEMWHEMRADNLGTKKLNLEAKASKYQDKINEALPKDGSRNTEGYRNLVDDLRVATEEVDRRKQLIEQFRDPNLGADVRSQINSELAKWDEQYGSVEDMEKQLIGEASAKYQEWIKNEAKKEKEGHFEKSFKEITEHIDAGSSDDPKVRQEHLLKMAKNNETTDKLRTRLLGADLDEFRQWIEKKANTELQKELEKAKTENPKAVEKINERESQLVEKDSQLRATMVSTTEKIDKLNDKNAEIDTKMDTTLDEYNRLVALANSTPENKALLMTEAAKEQKKLAKLKEEKDQNNQRIQELSEQIKIESDKLVQLYSGEVTHETDADRHAHDKYKQDVMKAYDKFRKIMEAGW